MYTEQQGFTRRGWITGLTFIFLIVSSAVTAQTTPRQSEPASKIIENGKFRFYELKQLQGEETYEIKRRSNGSLEVTAKMDLPFMRADEKTSLRTTLITDENLTPSSFQIQGTRPLGVPINTSIAIRAGSATVSVAAPDTAPETLRSREVTVPKTFFAFGGYVPVTMEMMLVRYWLAHGRPAKIALLPQGDAFVEYRGRDAVTVGGRRSSLQRYHLWGTNWGGGWGRQTLWFDSSHRLVAAVNRDRP